MLNIRRDLEEKRKKEEAERWLPKYNIRMAERDVKRFEKTDPIKCAEANERLLIAKVILDNLIRG